MTMMIFTSVAAAELGEEEPAVHFLAVVLAVQTAAAVPTGAHIAVAAAERAAEVREVRSLAVVPAELITAGAAVRITAGVAVREAEEPVDHSKIFSFNKKDIL